MDSPSPSSFGSEFFPLRSSVLILLSFIAISSASQTQELPKDFNFSQAESSHSQDASINQESMVPGSEMLPLKRGDYTLSISPESQATAAGGTLTYYVSISRFGGFNQYVQMTASGLPEGAYIPFFTSPTSPITFYVVTSCWTPPGRYRFALNSTTGGSLHSASTELIVTENKIDPSVCLLIESPKEGENFQITDVGLTGTKPIDFKTQGASGIVEWEVDLNYRTSSGRIPPGIPFQQSFETRGSLSYPLAFVSKGGQVTVRASTMIGGARVYAKPVSFTITGAAIPDGLITSHLIELYDGATDALLTGIASKESSYRQFRRLTIYGRQGLWPNESMESKPGSHIGLMMVPITKGIDNAWDWTANAKTGQEIFQAGYQTAKNRMMNFVRGIPGRAEFCHNGLRNLSPVELEDWGISLYGPYATDILKKQYYIPTRDATGRCIWKINKDGNPGGLAYTMDVRSRIKYAQSEYDQEDMR
jgi:hypothetical protein